MVERIQEERAKDQILLGFIQAPRGRQKKSCVTAEEEATRAHLFIGGDGLSEKTLPRATNQEKKIWGNRARLRRKRKGSESALKERGDVFVGWNEKDEFGFQVMHPRLTGRKELGESCRSRRSRQRTSS